MLAKIKDLFFWLRGYIDQEHLIEIAFHIFTLIGYISLALLIKYFSFSLVWGLFFTVWFLGTLLLITIYVVFRIHLGRQNEDVGMRIRYALLAMRRFSTYTAQRLADARRYIQDDNSLISLYNFNNFIRHAKQRIIRGIFYQISFGNTNLNIVYRVALFEPDNNDEMKVETFYNSDRLRPKIACLDKGFKIKEGVAGWAWHYKRPFCIGNVDSYMEEVRSGKVRENCFKTIFSEEEETSDSYEPHEIKSIICYPVVIREKKAEVVKAIVSIDCDKDDVLDNYPVDKAKKLRIQLQPYISLLGLIYSTVDFVIARASINVPESFEE